MTDDMEERGHIRLGTGAQRGRSAVVEIPLKLLVVADLAPPVGSDSAAEPARISIDKNNFGDVMKRLRPRLAFDSDNRLGRTPKEITVELAFEDIKSFRPEAVVAQVGPLKALMDLRGLLTDLKDQNISREEFQKQASGLAADSELVARLQAMLAAPRPASDKAGSQPQAATSQTSSGGKDGLDSLFDMVDADDGGSERGQSSVSALGGLIDAIAHPQKTEEPIDKKVVGDTIADVDSAVSAQLNEILHNEKFSRLESTWRGLKFLVDRTDFRENISVEVLNVAKDDLRDVLYEHVFRPEYDGVTDEPLSVIASGHSFDRSPKDIELLQDLSRMAESIQAPFIGSVGPGFFGLKSIGTLPGLPSLADKFRQPEYAKWNGFRDTEQSRWVALTANAILLRLPYGPEGVKVKSFHFEESAASGKPMPYMWGKGVWALASALVASFADTGWCLDISGPKSFGAIGDLPVRRYKIHGGEKVNIPLEIMLPDQKGAELSDAGLIPIACRPNDDMACVASVRTAHRPRRFDDPAVTQESMLHATLPYQLFAGRMSQHLQRLQQSAGGGKSKEEVETFFKEGILSALVISGERASDEAVQVEVTEESETPDVLDVILRIRPSFTILGNSVDLLLGVQLHK